MNKDSIRGRWEAFKGKVKKEYGEATGDRKTQIKGAVEEGVGKVHQGVGDVAEDLNRPSREDPKL
jgi:uncharacterized protein YjbJ (UPF0337 family)